jgi:hypothetical protein
MSTKIQDGQLVYWNKHFGAWPVHPGHPMIIACCAMMVYHKASEALARVPQGPSHNPVELVCNNLIPGTGGSCYLAVDLLHHIRTNWTETTVWHESVLADWNRKVKHFGADPRFRKAILFSRLQWEGISRSSPEGTTTEGAVQAAQNETTFLRLARLWCWK